MEKNRSPRPMAGSRRGVQFLRLVAPLSLAAFILSMLWFPGSRTSAQPPDLDAPFATPLYLMHVIGERFGGVEYATDFYFAYVEQPDTDGWVFVPDGYGGLVATHTTGPVSGPHTTPRQACQALPAGVTSFRTLFVVYDCVTATPTPTYTPTPTRTPVPTATATSEAPPLSAEAIGGGFVICSSTAQSSNLQHTDSPSACRTILDGQRTEIGEGDVFTQLLDSKKRGSGFRVSADCKDKVILLLELYFDGKKVPDEKIPELAILVDNLSRILQIACTNDTSTSTQSLPIPLDDPLTYALHQGQIEVVVLEKAISLGFTTNTATISAANLNHFLVDYDPVTQNTKITSLGGSLKVTPVNAAFGTFTLSPLQQVTVASNAVGDIVDMSSVYIPAVQTLRVRNSEAV